MKRLPLVLLLLALAAAAGWFGWQRFKPVEVALVTPVRGPAVDAVYATGLVEPSLEIRIAPRTAGRIVELLADEGDSVRAGQLLARLEDADLRASVAELESKVEYARSQFQRNTELRRASLVSQDVLDRSRTDLDAAEATLRRARAQVGYMRLVAPSAGRIIRRDGEIGEFVPVNQVMFYMAGPAPLRITADVDEEDVPRVQRGQRVLIRVDAFPDQVFEGKVDEITPRGDPVARSYRVRIGLDQPPAGLRVGMTVDANLIEARRAQALLLPASALRDGRLWRINAQGRAESFEVQPGARGNGKLEIKAGLAPDARVLRDPSELREGQRVREAS